MTSHAAGEESLLSLMPRVLRLWNYKDTVCCGNYTLRTEVFYPDLSEILDYYCVNPGGTRWRSWLRHCATIRKVAGSIPHGVIGIFHWHNSSGRTMAPGVDSASNRNEYQECFLGGKGGRCVGLTTLPPSCADCLEILEPQPPGTLRACPVM